MLIDDHDLEALRHAGERRLLLLTGTESWTITQAAMFWQPADLWLGHGPQPCDPMAIIRHSSYWGTNIATSFSMVSQDYTRICWRPAVAWSKRGGS